MRPTRLWRAIAATAGGLILVAAITVRITPAAIGLAVVVYLAHTRWSARHALQAASVRVRREVLADTVHRDTPVEVRLDAEDSRLPYGLSLVLEDHVPESLGLHDEHARVRGATRRSYVVEPHVTGSIAWETVHARLEDARGLWVHEEDLALPTEVRVLPSKQRLEAGRRLAKRNPLEAKRTDRRGTVMKELEFDSLRDFQPRDRLRDVDWKRYAKLEELVTREFEREREAPVVFLVDAGRTMRQTSSAEGEAKLDSAAEIVLELAESASAQGHAVGMVAFDELRVVETQRPSERRKTPSRLADLVSELPGRLKARRRLDVGLPEQAPVDETELDVLEQLALVRERASAEADTANDGDGEDDGGPYGDGEGRGEGGDGAGKGAGSQPSAATKAPSPSARPSTPAARSEAGAGLGFQRAVREIVAHVGANRVALIALTDLERFPDEAVRTLGRLSSRGHWVLTGVLPGSWFLDPPDTVQARDLENAYKEIETRQRAQRLLAARGVRVIELGPWSTAATVAEASGAEPTTSRGGASGRHGGDRAPVSPSQEADRGDQEADRGDDEQERGGERGEPAEGETQTAGGDGEGDGGDEAGEGDRR